MVSDVEKAKPAFIVVIRSLSVLYNCCLDISRDSVTLEQCVFAKCSLRCLLHLHFRVLSLEKGLAFCSAQWTFAFCLGMFSDSPDSVFYPIAFRVKVV